MNEIELPIVIFIDNEGYYSFVRSKINCNTNYAGNS